MKDNFLKFIAVTSLVFSNSSLADEGVNFGAKSGTSLSTGVCDSNTKDCEESSPFFELYGGYEWDKFGGITAGIGSILSRKGFDNKASSSINYFDLKYSKTFVGELYALNLSAGAFLWTQTETDYGFTSQEWGVSPMAGLKLMRQFASDGLYMYASYDYINSVGGSKTDENLLGLGFEYRFGSELKTVKNINNITINPVREVKYVDKVLFNETPNSKVCFDYDNYVLKDSDKKILDEFYEKSLVKQKLLIIGFADSRGSIEYNYDLVNQRINSVKNYLSSKDKDSDIIYDTVNNSNIHQRFDEYSDNRCVEIYSVYPTKEVSK